ncbi:hypothetical protein FY152_02545 [Agrobacterium tumefaciens]|uniref:hypothetical protein n=1 Tax=Rhizobium sp. TaxID=391 RepID=UPI00177BE429|nr:hypothetical protein [Agrobacterium tumefaciens]UXS30542.1 hypothetical protein FY152_02545 [Agrobacterium tumefaciens]
MLKKESRWRLTWDKYVDINLISQAELDAPLMVLLTFNAEIGGALRGSGVVPW